MTYKIGEVAKMVGVSIRTLHYYDEIGLLKPEISAENGYRCYSEGNLEMLQQILFFRELDFNLEEIKEIINKPNFDRKNALKNHKNLLIKKKARLEKIIECVEETINSMDGELKMEKKDMFKGFDMTEIENHKAKYAEETKRLYGGNDAYDECEKKTSKYTKSEWTEIMKKWDELYKKLALFMDKDPSDNQVQKTIAEFRQHITNNFYTCTPEIFRGLGDLYVNDDRFTANIDKYKEGLAKFLRDAMYIYCDSLENK